MKKKLIKQNRHLGNVNGMFGFRAENAYRERKKCVEKISKDFILQKNDKICRTDDLCMWRKQNKTAMMGSCLMEKTKGLDR